MTRALLATLMLPLIAAASGPFITQQTLGTVRNNWSGCVGFQFATGSKRLYVDQIGRWVRQGNTKHHQIILTDVAGAALVNVTLDLSTSAAGAEHYQYAPVSLTLQPNTIYGLYSIEANGGDEWYDYNTVATPTVDATMQLASYSTSTTGNCINPVGQSVAEPNRTFGPVNFTYQLLPLATVTISPTTVSAHFGQPLYCAAGWKPPQQVQVWCFTSSPGHTWDMLVYNSIFTVDGTMNALPNITSSALQPYTGMILGWQFRWTGGQLVWELGNNSVSIAQGIFGQ